MLELFAQGREAALKLRVLLSPAAIAGVLKWRDSGAFMLPRPGPGFLLPALGKLPGIAGISAKNPGFVFDPSLLLAGFGAIIGFHTGLSLLLGGILSWGLLGPWGLFQGFIVPGADDPGASWFATMIEWLLWRGVSLVVGSALTRCVLQGVSYRLAAATPDGQSGGDNDGAMVTRLPGLALASALVVITQVMIFDIHWFIATPAVPIAFLLATVASRVVGETGIPPIGANVAGGAAGQSADLLHDLKVGHMIGTPARFQIAAQCFGVLTGSVIGSIVYLHLIPDPATMLITEEWPAPAVATWKVVAGTFRNGLGAVPVSALQAMAIGGGAGIAVAWLQHRRAPRWLPNIPAFGLAMVIPASISITMFFGSLVGKLLERYRPDLAQRFLIAAASGLIAGESPTGVVRALPGIAG